MAKVVVEERKEINWLIGDMRRKLGEVDDYAESIAWFLLRDFEVEEPTYKCVCEVHEAVEELLNKLNSLKPV